GKREVVIGQLRVFLLQFAFISFQPTLNCSLVIVIEISRAEPGSVASRDTNRCTHVSIRREIYLGKQRKERHELIYFSDCIMHDRAPEPSGKRRTGRHPGE